MRIDEIYRQLEAYCAEGKRLFATSSFQTQSLVLLHILSKVEPRVPVVFLNTGYHFPETIRFRDEVVERLGLELVDLKPSTPKYLQLDAGGRLLFASDPDHCCTINKIQPMEAILRSHDVWINGVRGDQGTIRTGLRLEESAPHGVVRFHPLIGWSARDIYEYRMANDLPEHPLEEKGYLSVGCEPCTRRSLDARDTRSGRWFGMQKKECGLHTDLLKGER